MLKQPALKSLNLHIWVLLCNCQTYDDNIGSIYIYPSFAQLYAKNMFKNIYWATYFIGHLAFSLFYIKKNLNIFFEHI